MACKILKLFVCGSCVCVAGQIDREPGGGGSGSGGRRRRGGFHPEEDDVEGGAAVAEPRKVGWRMYARIYEYESSKRSSGSLVTYPGRSLLSPLLIFMDLC